MKIGVFLPNWVGDAVMATPTLRALSEHFGDRARLVGILRPYVADVLAGTTWLDEQLLFDPRSADSRQRGLGFFRQLRRQKLDMAIVLPNSWRAALWARASGAQERIGYVRGGRGWLLNRKLDPQQANGRFTPSPVLDYFLDLAYAAGAAPNSRHVELATLPADERAAGAVWAKFRFPSGGQVVALNSGGAFGAAKLWPTGYFASLARRIAVEDRRSVLVVCGPKERELAREIVRSAAHPRVQSLADERLGIGLTKACIRRSGLLVTTDSGPRHFAAAFGVPAITLFGPTDIAWSENYHPRAVHLQLELDCVPCQQRTCPLGHHRCMRDLSIEEVHRAVRNQLQMTPQTAAA
ncbi:MAG TPA: lipopolysaccharide heptosyltransferase II [Pirellulales bacterium]|nr:lipopolysaccharide heptosyltransferase II [Pirellulales bacterium]